MGRTWLPVTLSALLAQPSLVKDDSMAQEAARKNRDGPLQIYTTPAVEYTIHRDVRVAAGARARVPQTWIDRIDLTTTDAADTALLDYLVKRAKTF
jgi:hypothetical protein